jgi:adenylosuccinate lyase
MEKEIFANISPLDHRYYLSYKELFDQLAEYFSENALIKTQLQVEAALTRVLARRGICPESASREVDEACLSIDPEEVYAEEEKTKHSIRAMVNCIQRRVSVEARPFVHFTSTSMDIVDTANALRFFRATNEVVLPRVKRLLETLITIARREKEVLQIGRTHGQHAVPITFGFAVAEYVSRLGSRYMKIKEATENLRGKVAGAVGAYNASSIFFSDPDVFEAEVLTELGIRPSPYSTQIVEPEFLTDYLHAIVSAYGVLANLADDFRHLQRTEISEIGEEFVSTQVGSSTMPHKRNPWNFEHVKSMWKAFMPRMITVYLDQISEHQRDLTNSASSRFNPEIVVSFTAAVERLNRVLSRLKVDEGIMMKNVELTHEYVIAEPLYILLASFGHPDAHEAVRRLTLKSQETGKTVRQLITTDRDRVDREILTYLEKFTQEHWKILNNPKAYIGLSVQKTELICAQWEEYLRTHTCAE